MWDVRWTHDELDVLVLELYGDLLLPLGLEIRHPLVRVIQHLLRSRVQHSLDVRSSVGPLLITTRCRADWKAKGQSREGGKERGQGELELNDRASMTALEEEENDGTDLVRDFSHWSSDVGHVV